LLAAVDKLSSIPPHLPSGATQNGPQNQDSSIHSDAEDGDDESDGCDIRPRRKAKKLVQHRAASYNNFQVSYAIVVILVTACDYVCRV
jgi:hypothetical protein